MGVIKAHYLENYPDPTPEAISLKTRPLPGRGSRGSRFFGSRNGCGRYVLKEIGMTQLDSAVNCEIFPRQHLSFPCRDNISIYCIIKFDESFVNEISIVHTMYYII